MSDQLWFSITIRKTVWMAWPPPGVGGMDVLVAVGAVVGLLVAVAVGTGVLVRVAVGAGVLAWVAVGTGVLVALAVPGVVNETLSTYSAKGWLAVLLPICAVATPAVPRLAVV